MATHIPVTFVFLTFKFCAGLGMLIPRLVPVISEIWQEGTGLGAEVYIGKENRAEQDMARHENSNGGLDQETGGTMTITCEYRRIRDQDNAGK
jgi:hypothetical protein